MKFKKNNGRQGNNPNGHLEAYLFIIISIGTVLPMSIIYPCLPLVLIEKRRWRNNRNVGEAKIFAVASYYAIYSAVGKCGKVLNGIFKVAPVRLKCGSNDFKIDR